MSTFLKIVRYIFAILFIIIIIPLYFLGLPLVATTQTFVNRENVKEIINQPQVYGNVIDGLASSLNLMHDTQSVEGMEDILELFEEGTQFSKNIETVITSGETKQKMNTVIDAFYDWFEGKTDSPQFEVYLIEDEQVFKELFISVITVKLKNLRTCEDSSLPDSDGTILELECLPPNIDKDEIGPLLEENLDQVDLDEVMESMKFSSDQINISYNDSVLVQSVYKLLKLFPIILVGVLLLLTTLVIFLIPGFKGGLITTSIIYMLGGMFYLLLSTVGKLNRLLFTALNTADLPIPQVQMQNFVNTLLSPVIDKIMKYLTTYSLIGLGVGIVLLILGIVIKKKGIENIPIETNTEEGI
jgi:hypothetical protein